MSLRARSQQAALDLYRRLLARPALARLHRLGLVLSLKGLGLLNSDSFRFSGEAWLWERWLPARRPRLILDVGAHRGSYALEVRRRFPEAQVFAFEPHPLTFKDLEQTARGAGFTAVPLGLGDQPGRLLLYDYAAAGGSEHASFHDGALEGNRAGVQAFEAGLTTLDLFLTEHGLGPVDLLKIDTEGHELAVLRGGRQALAAGQVRAIQFEFGPAQVYSRVFLRDFREALPGYQLYRLLPGGLLPLEPYEPTFHELFAYQNLLAIPRAG